MRTFTITVETDDPDAVEIIRDSTEKLACNGWADDTSTVILAVENHGKDAPTFLAQYTLEPGDERSHAEQEIINAAKRLPEDWVPSGEATPAFQELLDKISKHEETFGPPSLELLQRAKEERHRATGPEQS